MKGMDEPVKMFRAVATIDANYFEPPLIVARDRKSALPGSGAGASSDIGMVGRGELVALIEHALYQFSVSGDGFVMLMRGAPGVGKTKLVEEISRRCALGVARKIPAGRSRTRSARPH